MSRTKNTQLLAVISAMNLLITSVFSIIIGRLILVYLGSEYNGINSIVSQFIMIISVFEGGFTTASLVSMMKPYEQKDRFEINQIFAETKKKFQRITVLSLLIGIMGAVAFGYVVKTNISVLTVISVLMIGLISSVFNMGVVSKYRLIFQVAQEEHVFAIVTLCSTIIGQLGMIVVLLLTKNIILLRFVGMITAVIAGFIAIRVFSKRYIIINKVEWDGKNRIKGTKDVLVGKVVGTIHYSSTALFLSIFSNAAITSVYAVYNSIIHVITSVANICFAAPQNAIGQILQGDDSKLKQKIVLEYEYIIIIMLTILFVPLNVLLVPFVRIYTQGVTDVQYINSTLAILMIVSTYFQLIHIPAGVCIYMSGSFKIAKKIQIIALVILLLGNVVLGKMYAMYGFLISVMICNAFLAVFEIIYVHKKIIKNSLSKFMIRWIPNILILAILVAIGESVSHMAHNMFSWVMIACIITIVSFVFTMLFNMLLFRKDFYEIIERLMSVIKKSKKSKL